MLCQVKAHRLLHIQKESDPRDITKTAGRCLCKTRDYWKKEDVLPISLVKVDKQGAASDEHEHYAL